MAQDFHCYSVFPLLTCDTGTKHVLKSEKDTEMEGALGALTRQSKFCEDKADQWRQQ